MILFIKTDQPEAELKLYTPDGKQLQEIRWLAHTELSATIHLKLQELLAAAGAHLHDLTGIVMFEGPGSFTGLRIGLSVGNALADGLNIPCCGSGGEDWIKDGLRELSSMKAPQVVLPEYGAEPNISKPRK